MKLLITLLDFVPVVLFALASLVLQRDLYRKMGKGAFALFSSGTICVSMAGMFKALWKLLYNLNICDYPLLNHAYFPMAAIGFVLAGIGMIALLCHPNGNANYGVAVPVLFTSTMPFIITMGFGLLAMNAALMILAFRRKKVAAGVLFGIAMVFAMGIGFLSSRGDSSDSMNLMIACVNTVGQGAFLAGALLFRECEEQTGYLRILKAVEERFSLHETSVGEFSQLKVAGLKYSVRRFEVAEVGTLSVMSAHGFFGLMNMDVFMITPLYREMPLLSFDRIQAMGNDTCLFELYDTPTKKGARQDLSALDDVKAAYAALPAYPIGTYWYENIRLSQSDYKKGRGITPQLDEMAMAYVGTYLELLRKAPVCDASVKRAKTMAYVDGLLTHGGPATDIFIKKMGREKTEALFKTVLFF